MNASLTKPTVRQTIKTAKNERNGKIQEEKNYVARHGVTKCSYIRRRTSSNEIRMR